MGWRFWVTVFVMMTVLITGLFVFAHAERGTDIRNPGITPCSSN